MTLPFYVSLVYYILIYIATLLALLILPHILIFLALIIFGLPISTKKEYDKPSKFYYWLFNLGYWTLLTCGRAKIHVTGMEKLPKDGKFMFTSNHRSKFDNMVHSYILRKYPIAFISKKENFKIPIGKHFMVRSCYLSIDRGNVKQGITVIQRAINFIAEDITNIGIFPEGTRSTDMKVHDYKPGCFKIAVKSNCPIVVSSIYGTENIHKNFPWKRTDVYFDIIDVIYPEQYKDMNTIEIAKKVENLVVQKIENYNN